MNGYVEAGYVVALTTLAGYGASLRLRERALRRRIGPSSAPAERAEAAETRPGDES